MLEIEINRQLSIPVIALKGRFDAYSAAFMCEKIRELEEGE